MKKYYVYELIDPRNDKPFYVGKGSGERMYYHIKEVKRNRVPNGNTYLERKIKKILNAGLKVQYRIIQENMDENLAYDLEMNRISEISIKNLCNLSYGGEGLRATKKVKIKISKSTKKRFENPEERKKISVALKGNIPWNKNKKGVQVAWNKGLTKEADERVRKYSNTKMGHGFTDKALEKMSETKKKRLKDGVYTVWNKGKKGCQTAWNKGLTTADERVRRGVEKMHESRKGMLPWNKGITTPLEQRKTMIKIECSYCGNVVWKRKDKLKNIKTPTCSKKCNGKLLWKNMFK